MSAILDKLLKGQKVEWETIGDLGILNRGKRLVRSQLGESARHPVRVRRFLSCLSFAALSIANCTSLSSDYLGVSTP